MASQKLQKERIQLGLSQTRDPGPSAEASPRTVSIIVRTCNREEKLRHTLEAIRSFEVPEGCAYEVIVADNGSHERTVQVCAEAAAEFAGNLRHVYVLARGGANAGNAGLEEARGNIIAILDDDILPRRDWLTTVWREFSTDPELDGLSGRVELANEADLPVGIRRQNQRMKFESLSDAYSLFAGCNVAVRRSLIDRVGFFDPDFGPSSQFFSAEDCDFFYRAWKAGAKMIYEPALFVTHDHGRRSRKAMLETKRGYLVGRGAFYAKHIWAGDRTAARHLYWELRTAGAELFRGRDGLGWRYLTWLLGGFGAYSLRLVVGAAKSKKAGSGGRNP